MSLKNVTRERTVKHGRSTWLLRDTAGKVISAYSYFCQKNLDYAFTTQKRYAEVVALFIDYLIEAQAFGVSATKRHLNDVIDAYPILLRDGSAGLSERFSKSIDQNPQELWLLKVAESLKRQPLSPKSFSNTLAAINRFLRLSEALAIEAFEKAALAGIKHRDSYRDLIEALSGSHRFTPEEVRNMGQNSMLGSVIRFKSGGMTRPRRLTFARSNTDQKDLSHLDFPIDHVMALIEASLSQRDKALWLLLAASGVRVSEALNLRWSDLDIEKQKVYVYDPHGRRFGSDMTPHEKLKFKGRTVSMTYLIQPFRQEFFKALEQYYRNEFVPPREEENNGHVFQYIDKSRRGRPLVGVSSVSLNANLKAACTRAGVPLPVRGSEAAMWTIHSLRHMYGVYMVNDFPVDLDAAVFGLELSEVQKLMGHKNISSTKHYARQKRALLEQKLARADRDLLNLNTQRLSDRPNK